MTTQPTERTFTAAEALEGARAYFREGCCSGHAQFNGRYCRDEARPERWCIHCAGCMLVAALTAAAERETALREENGELREQIGELITPDLAELTEQRAITAEAALAEAQREIARLTNESVSREQYDDVHAIAVRKDQLWSEACDALTAERQKVTALREWLNYRLSIPDGNPAAELVSACYREVQRKCDALGLTAIQTSTDEPET